MTVYNQLGKEFRLTSPNPLMKNQNFAKEINILHNFTYEEFTSYVYGLNQLQNLESIEPEEFIVEIKEKPLPAKKKEPTPTDLPKSLFYCLPAVINKEEDLLYGETKESLFYLPKITFDGVVADNSDFNFVIWTNGIEISINSIIFDPKSRRWWKTISTENKAGGLLLTTVPSDFTPSFD